MAREAGVRLGPYEITGKLGEGGMGEVYRATDSRLKREVAIKVLPNAFTEDPERLARFEREAQVLAQLHHPHIASIFGLEESEGVRALVMELVEGPTLADKIAAGPLPVDEAIAVARQIAEALEDAHEKGIVHRDLKPANVKVRPDGAVKVLDFGLAKALDPTASASAPALAHSPTITSLATQAGLILGTAAYMAPEQARGGAVDRRADIWAFGVVLYEMLTGDSLFAGDTVSDTLAGVLKTEIDLGRLPGDTPAAVRRLLRHCLERNLDDRLHDIADVRILLGEAQEGPLPTEAVAAPALRRWTGWLGWAVACAALALVAPFAWRGRAPRVAPAVTRLEVQLPEGARLVLRDIPVLALSPDGRELAFTAADPQSGQPVIYVRRMDDTEAHPIGGTERGSSPILSPSGDAVAFFSDRELKKIQLGGGAPFTLAEATSSRGGSWSPDGATIYYSPEYASGIWRVPAAGGTAEPVVEPDANAGERTFRWPQALPGGRALLFTVGSSDSPNNYDKARLEAFTLDTKKRRVLVRGANMGRFAPPDHLVYARAGVLYAVHFDPERLEVSGAPTPVLQGVGGDPSSGVGYFDLAADGTLAYLRGDLSDRDVFLTLVDRQGKAERIPIAPRGFGYPRFSPDGTRLAVSVGVNPVGTDGDLWVFTPSSGSMERLTFSGNAIYPSWTPDGSRIVYAEMQKAGLYLKPADGTGSPELVTRADEPSLPESWSPDGRTLAYVRIAKSTDVYLQTVGGEPRLFERDASGPVFSPDGRWIAYSSPSSGESKVFVRSVTGDGKWQISTGGGGYARWPAPGDEIYYIAIDSPDRSVMSVPVGQGPAFRAGPPRQVIASTGGYFVTSTAPSVNWDVAPGGRRFVFTEQQHGVRSDSVIAVALNWTTHVGSSLR
jgi:Tol biopolymer transport system component